MYVFNYNTKNTVVKYIKQYKGQYKVLINFKFHVCTATCYTFKKGPSINYVTREGGGLWLQ